ncbi:MAG: AAA family ATPase, partial [Planctomycetaceae bacterium]
MSRHTRRLRKQARAQAATREATHTTQLQPAQTGFDSGATAVLDRPASLPRHLSHTPCLDELDPDDLELDGRWAETDLDETAGAAEVQTREIGSRDARRREPGSAAVDCAAGGPLVPVPKASRSAGTVAPRRVIPGREPIENTPPGKRRQPHNDGWLWRDKICVGDLVVIVGEEGAGKTRLLTDWIARVTTGRAFPGSDDPSQALPPSDVLVFNCVDDFRRDIVDQVSLNGGDAERVLHASTQVLDWGHTHSEFPEGPFATPGLAAGEPPEPRVRLHTQEILRKLGQFLLRRPSSRLVVVDQLKQHLKTDSERVCEDLIHELQVLGRQTEVTFVLTQRPDAFRNATGIKQYFKSDSLTSVA